MAPTSQFPQSRRRPLGDGTQSANLMGKGPQLAGKSYRISSPSGVSLPPHHESLMADGSLTLHNVINSPGNKRISVITAEIQSDSKRSSQVSTTSTNTSSSKGGRRKTHIGPWQLGRDIGQGHSCKVRKVRHTVTGQQAAVKIIDKKVAEQGRSESLANLAEMARKPYAGALAATSNVMPFGIEREVVILKLLEHPNVVKLYDIWENRSQLYLVMEYVDGGELFDYVADQNFLAEDETVWLFRQMVAALLHCHRLGIHHRDLKPENILIDTADDSLSVKLADFGMAVLQPKGQQLTTACGSVHYAAPEVFERRYDGSKVDVWSLGVILYVMLTGTTPFTYDQQTMAADVSLWYNVIKAGKFPMPDELSTDAQDLILKMLQPNPQLRITLEGVWNHPFIHKYAFEWGESKDHAKLENWIGPQPIIETWNVKTQDDIDREILRNLRTLWHSEREEVLIQRLTSPQPNQEKYFYFALQKHREDQLENYVGTFEGVTCSSSDYHHMNSTSNPHHFPQAAPAIRTKSQFSILNDEHLQSRNSLINPPASVKSYDPFRASRDPIIVGKEKIYTNVVVHRDSSLKSRNSCTRSLPKPPSARAESLRKSQHRLSTASSCVSLKYSSPRYSTHSGRSKVATRRSTSRSSMGNSLYPSSPPFILKPRAKHKRSVNFSHRSRASSTRPSTAADDDNLSTATPPKQRKEYGKSLNQNKKIETLHSNIIVEKTRSSKDAQVHERAENNTIEHEARKVSTELEKFCEEAFNRSSAGSSHCTSATISHRRSETPPSSVSKTKSLASFQDATLSNSAKQTATPIQQQPSNALTPTETPNTFIARELAETRRRFAARYAQDQNFHSDHYLEVLAHLNSLLKPVSTSDKRTSSAPETRYGEHPTQLAVISEDKLLDTRVPSKQSSELKHSHSEMADLGSGRHIREDNPLKSIRIVEDSSPPRPAPLVIRKASKDSISGHTTNESAAKARLGSTLAPKNLPTRKTSPTSPDSLDTICEEQSANAGTVRQQMNVETNLTKKKNWWRRKQSSEALNQVEDDFKTEISRRADPNNQNSQQLFQPDPMACTMSGALRDTREGFTEKKVPFLRLFTRRRSPQYAKNMVLGNTSTEHSAQKYLANSPISRTGSSTLSMNRPFEAGDRNDRHDRHDLGVQRHWLARLFHIKPSMKILCFQVTRGRARAEITRLLRSWRPHGIRDVVLDRERNLVFGRLDAINALGFKEVQFVAEIFVVLEEGKRRGLSIARFTQRKGAASSFKRVVEEIETRLTAKGMIIMEKEVRKEMELLLADGSAR